MFMLRPPSMLDESLSSWRQRAGMANGFVKFPVPSKTSYSRDFDRTPGEQEMRWLCESFRTDEATLKRLTLDNLGDGVFIRYGRQLRPRWVVPVGQRMAGLGSVYCPICLAEDVPYFRLAWRLAFLSSCPLHGCQLVERCSACGASVWPASLRLPWSRMPRGLAYCTVCSNSLSSMSPVASDPGDCSAALMCSLRNDSVPDELSQCACMPDMFNGLWCMAEMLLRSHTMHLRMYLPFNFESEEESQLVVELLPLRRRKQIVTAAYWLMQDWPHRFLEVARDGNISKHQIPRCKIPFPIWLSDVVENELARHIVGLSSAVIDEAILAVESSGQAITKMAVRRLLGISEAKALNTVLGQRRRATWAEFGMLCQMFEHHCSVVPSSRGQLATTIRDYLIVLISVLCRKRVESVCCLGRGQVDEILIAHVATDSERAKVAKRARELNSLYESKVRCDLGGISGQENPWFVARLGRTMIGHCVRARVAKMMKDGFPTDLWNSIDVFLTLDTTCLSRRRRKFA